MNIKLEDYKAKIKLLEEEKNRYLEEFYAKSIKIFEEKKGLLKEKEILNKEIEDLKTTIIFY
ncbi:hypothetical protein [Streptobacillus moniliformis]|uniref:hypothetical protein n=1 Tax=Streptobacillus moniliformis TaxID=34105 RepID=UPI0007E4029D|nr:hypothetical protein [Streptobacillus moniliformis]